MPLRVTRRNVQGGFRDATGFHPFRSSADYDPELAGDDYGARTDGTGFKRYTRTRKTEAAKKRRRKVATKGKRKTTAGRKRNPPSQMVIRDKVGNIIQRSKNLAGIRKASGSYPIEVINLTKLPDGEGSLFIRFKDYGTSNKWDGATFETKFASYTVLKDFVSRWRNVKGVPLNENPRRKRSASLLRPARGKESPRVRKALTKYVRGKSNPSTPYYSKERAMKAAREFRALGQNAKVTSKWEGNQKVYWVHNSPKAKNPGKRKRAERARYDKVIRERGLRRPTGSRSLARFEHKAESSRRRGRQAKAPGLQSNPHAGGSKLYEVRIPRTSSDIGYTLTIRAKTKRTARAEAKSYCATSFSKKTGKPKSAYRLPSTTKVTEVR